MRSIGNLAFRIKRRGRHVEAISFMKKCVRLQRRIVDENHPHFVSCSAALAQWVAEQLGASGLARDVAEGKREAD